MNRLVVRSIAVLAMTLSFAPVLAIGSAPPAHGARFQQRVTRLVSHIPSGVQDTGVCGAQRHGCHIEVTPDGRHVFFMLNEGPLFDWSGGVAKLVSVGPLGTGTLGGLCYPYGGECAYDPSPDARSVFFVTPTPLVPEDTQHRLDLYLRANGQTTLLSTLGPLGGVGSQRLYFDGLSADRSRAYYAFYSLDGGDDPWLYEWTAGEGVSRFPSEATPAEHPDIRKRLSANGEHVIFSTTSALVSQDTDSCQRGGDSHAHGCSDLYERTSDGRVKLLTIGPLGGGGSFDVHVVDISADGRDIVFSTGERLVPEDTDSCPNPDGFSDRGCSDVYERTADGKVKLLTTGPLGGSGPFDAQLLQISDDRRDILFSTGERLVPEDTDSCPNPDVSSGRACRDIYERTPDGTVKLLTTGPKDGGGPYDAELLRRAKDGGILFRTRESLVPEDTDSCPMWGAPQRGCDDIYERTADGKTVLISVGDGPYDARFFGAAPDFSWVLFRTDDALVADDVNDSTDLYERIGNDTRVIATNPNSGLLGDRVLVSSDGSKVFWETNLALVRQDQDYPPNVPPDPNYPSYWRYSASDVYEFAGSKVALISTGPTDTNEPIDAHLDHISDDGRYVYFHTAGQLTAGDTNKVEDTYVRDTVAGTTKLIVNAATGGAHGDVLATSRNGRLVLFSTREALVPKDTDDCKSDYPPGGCPDLYLHDRVSGTSTLISTGPTDDQGECKFYGRRCPQFIGASPDLSRIYFQTDLPLVADDRDGELKDVYVSTLSPPGCKDRGSERGPAKCP